MFLAATGSGSRDGSVGLEVTISLVGSGDFGSSSGLIGLLTGLGGGLSDVSNAKTGVGGSGGLE